MSDAIKEAGAKRAAALSERDAATVEALQIERNGYVVRGYTDRVKQVDAELAKYLKVEKPKVAEGE